MGSELNRRGFHGLEGQILSVGVTIIRGEWGEWEKWELMGMDGNDAIYRKKADELSRQPFDGHYNNEVLASDDPLGDYLVLRGRNTFEGERVPTLLVKSLPLRLAMASTR